eukprot:TRINITY_DN10677_c0_g1_i2.p1 TRINITY_DN10677_c0_g1~~TRINITY_DN10677_c0_g1_i2.p1  ORF type:complete len:446 (+),score=88.47 TRINITY_DN10677_c0_g1_i2:73-1410(+)
MAAQALVLATAPLFALVVALPSRTFGVTDGGRAWNLSLSQRKADLVTSEARGDADQALEVTTPPGDDGSHSRTDAAKQQFRAVNRTQRRKRRARKLRRSDRQARLRKRSQRKARAAARLHSINGSRRHAGALVKDEGVLRINGTARRHRVTTSHSAFARNLLVIGDTVKQVQDVIGIVNSTTGKFVSRVLRSSSGFTVALERANMNAQHLQGVIGKNVVMKQAKLFNQMSEAVAPTTEQLTSSFEHMQELFVGIVSNFMDVGRNLLMQFEVAFYAVAKLHELHGSVSLLQLRQKGIVEWFRSTFAGASDGTPCGQAKLQILEANDTTTRLGLMLLALNTTANTNFLDGAVKSIDDGFEQLEAVKQTGTSTYSRGLPRRLLKTVNATVNALGDVADNARSMAFEAQSKIEAKLVGAWGALGTLHEAARDLLVDRDVACDARSDEAE